MRLIEPKGGSFSPIGVTGRPRNWAAGTISHGGVRITTRRAVELQQAYSHGELGQGMGFVLIHLHGEVRGVKAKLDCLVSSHEVVGVSRDGHGTVAARVRGRIGIAWGPAVPKAPLLLPSSA